MVVKLTVTTRCNAKCKTCPVWSKRQETMSVDTFREVWARINSWRGVGINIGKIFLNSTGDLNALEDKRVYYNIIEKLQAAPVSITMNGCGFDYVPRVHTLIVSFNGTNREGYERTTGLDFDQVVENIRAQYGAIRERTKYREINCLIWAGNAGASRREEQLEFLELWEDFPGVVRVGYKAENQFGKYFGLEEYRDEERIPCDYLTDGITIAPSGHVIRCAHDFDFTEDWGHVLETSLLDILYNPARQKLLEAHRSGDYPGICETCNYNVKTEGKFLYARGAV